MASKNGARRSLVKTPTFFRLDGTTRRPDGYGSEERLDLFQKSFKAHVWVYSCVKMIMSGIASAPILPYIQKADGSWIEDLKHPLRDLILNPNPYFTSYMMRQYLGAALALTGNAFWFRDREAKELWPLIPGNVKAVSTPDALIDHYLYRVGGQDVVIDYADVLHFRQLNPDSWVWGQGDLSAAKNVVMTDIFAQLWNKSFMLNSAKPEGVLETDQTIDDDAVRNRLIQSWNDLHRGVDKAGSTGLLEAGVKYTPIGGSMKDMDFVNLRKDARVEICAAFGVPPSIVGLLEYANYSNLEQQTKNFWLHTLIPTLTNVSEMMTLRSKQMTGREATWQADTSKVAALQANLKEQADTYKTFVDGGVPPNQVIEAMDLPFEAFEGGDISSRRFPLIPQAGPAPADVSADVPTPAQENPEPKHFLAAACPTCGSIFDCAVKSGQLNGRCPRGHAVGKAAEDEIVAARKAMRDAAWKSFDSRLTAREDKARSEMRLFFAGQHRRVSAAIEKNGRLLLHQEAKGLVGLIKRLLGMEKKDANEVIKISFDLEAEQILLAAASERFIRGTYFDFAVSAARSIKPTFDFNLQDPYALQWVASRTLNLSRQANATTLESLTDEVVQAVQDAVAAGLSEGDAVAQIRDRIDAVYEFANDVRSETIARTESIMAANAGTNEGFKQTGVEKKSWLSARDSKVRDTHQQLDGQVVGVDESFVSSSGAVLRYPADPDAPADEVVNCRCAMIAESAEAA